MFYTRHIQRHKGVRDTKDLLFPWRNRNQRKCDGSEDLEVADEELDAAFVVELVDLGGVGDPKSEVFLAKKGPFVGHPKTDSLEHPVILF